MKSLSEKLALLQAKINHESSVTIMIIGLGSVGLYLLDYLVQLSDSRIHVVVAGRNTEKMKQDVNIIRTAATIRGQLQSVIDIAPGCDLDNPTSIAYILDKYHPDFIINSSRVYSGLKYGSISWSNLRAYGIWTPLSVRYARNIMEAYEQAKCQAISINTSYSDVVIPWLKSANKAYFDFGSGNLNHLIPRMKFYIAEKFNIHNLNDIDITLAVSHFHDVVISKEGHAEGQNILINISYQGKKIDVNKPELFKSCMIPMPVDQKRNMMNASSNFILISAILDAVINHKKVKVHSPGVEGEIGGYPYIIDASKEIVTSYFDTSIYTLREMREANNKSIYLDGIENINNGSLFYTEELINNVKSNFKVDIPKRVDFSEIDFVSKKIISEIIIPYG